MRDSLQNNRKKDAPLSGTLRPEVTVPRKLWSTAMDPDFWHQRWAKNEIGFHQKQVNPLLLAHFKALSLAPGRIFLPLCGMTLDIPWLLSQGWRVAGAELSPLAVAQLFDTLGVEPAITRSGALEHHRTEGLDLFVGDIFALTRQALGPVDAVYDRAALVALPQAMREQYAAHLMAITEKAPQLLICFDYDQSQLDGPPFCVNSEEVHHLYAHHCQATLLSSTELPGGLKGQCPAQEQVWCLRRF